MRTIKKGYVPDYIEYKGEQLKLNIDLQVDCTLQGRNHIYAAKELERTGKKVCVLICTNRRLIGKTDLHGQPYKPHTYIFSN